MGVLLKEEEKEGEGRRVIHIGKCWEARGVSSRQLERARTGRFTSGSRRTSAGPYRRIQDTGGRYQLGVQGVPVAHVVLYYSIVIVLEDKVPFTYVVLMEVLIWVRPGRFW